MSAAPSHSSSPPHPLNPAQREAARYLDGPCLVLAGAGSGKTRVITHKIAHLVQEAGYAARNIAALTFTNKAAQEMQERVAQLLPKELSGGLTVCTFHSLGVRMVREEAKALGLKPNFSIMDADDCFGLVQQLCATTDKQLIRRIQTAISLWKNGLVSPDDANHLASDENQAQAARIYRSYNTTLTAYQAVDFDDLIRLPAELLQRDDEARTRWQNRLRYLLVDEYQDTNACQYQLLKLIAGPRAAFTAVGDDDQAIYAWRGATLENLRQLQTDFAQLKVIKLEQNYRSSLRILQAANSLIANNPKLFEKKLWSDHGLGDAIHISMADSDEHEAESVVIKLQAHKFERRAKFSDYAILYRGNHQARVFEQALRKEKIPYLLSGGQSFFDRAEIRDIIAYLRLLVNQDDDPAFIRAVTTPKRGIGSATLEALGTYAGEREVSLFTALFESGLETRLAARQIELLRTFGEFINRIEWRAQREPAGEVLDELMKALDYEAYLYDGNDDRTAQSKWQNVLDFTNWLKQKGEEDEEGKAQTLLQLTQTIALISMLDKKDSEQDAVRLSTLHAAKGLEYPHVFLVGVEEGLLPHKGSEDDDLTLLPARIEEERRLMYVGITRAQRSLHVSWCKKRKRGREMAAREASRFIGEMQVGEGQVNAPEEAPMSSKERLSNLKALLNKTM